MNILTGISLLMMSIIVTMIIVAMIIVTMLITPAAVATFVWQGYLNNLASARSRRAISPVRNIQITIAAHCNCSRQI